MSNLPIVKAETWRRSQLAVNTKIENQVASILCDIRQRKDEAIDEYAQMFDKQAVKSIKLKAFDEYDLDSELKTSIQLAAERIEKFALFQKQTLCSQSFEDQHGHYGQQILPIERVGAYIPGGRHPLISSALMTLIPAKIANCPVRIACTPSNDIAIQAAASLAGATDFIQIGGVQAIAALAYGFAENTPVDIVVGPGNAWVNEAKKQIQGNVKIDGLAGPSELLAICDGKQPIEWLALDALAQAEHDPLASSLILSDDSHWLSILQDYLENNLETQQLIDNKQIELLYAKSPKDLIHFSNQYAAEHLMLCHEKIQAEQLKHYGSLFIGANSGVALGDYISGPNHTLPTLSYARQNGGLNVQTFLRVLTTQSINDTGRQYLSKMAMPLAKAEGLNFHYQSLAARYKTKH